jgi:hypothetical protein
LCFGCGAAVELLQGGAAYTPLVHNLFVMAIASRVMPHPAHLTPVNLRRALPVLNKRATTLMGFAEGGLFAIKQIYSLQKIILKFV